MAEEDSTKGHWDRHAARWQLLGPPLRPSPADVETLEGIVVDWLAAAGRAPCALLLGVTPEIATLAWPAGTRLIACDREQALIDGVFPGAGVPDDTRAIRADWRALPVPDRSIDLVFGDGSLTCLAYPDGYRDLAAELSRVTSDGAQVALRVFTLPEAPETLDAVRADLDAGCIRSFHALKWRIAAAITPPARAVAVRDILRAFETLIESDASWRDLASRCGWSPRVIETLEAYRTSALVYSFPTRDEVCQALGEHFRLRGAHHGDYELAERCPTLVFGRAT